MTTEEKSNEVPSYIINDLDGYRERSVIESLCKKVRNLDSDCLPDSVYVILALREYIATRNQSGDKHA